MPPRPQRPHIPPTWRAGLRRGTVRNETTLALERCPGMKAKLLRIIAELDAQGFKPISMAGVRQPFDYAPRWLRTPRDASTNPN